MANIEKIVLPDNTEYDVKDANAYPITGGSATPITGSVRIQPTDSTDFMQLNALSGYNSIQNEIFVDGSSTSTPIGGMEFIYNNGTKATAIYANGGNIYFRPNGQGVTDHTTYITTDGWLEGTNFRRITFTGGEVIQVGHFCSLWVYHAITSTAAGNTWNTLETPSGIPTPVRTYFGVGHLTTDNGHCGGDISLRINTSKQIAYSTGGSTGSWTVCGYLAYWTNAAA